MKILVINPNTTETMTTKIALAAKTAVSSGVDVFAVNPHSGPESIEGYLDEALCLNGLLKLVYQNTNYDAFVIACFDDTGLDAARCLTNKPVIGIGEAAFHMASLISNRFSVVTTLPRSISAIEHNLDKYGLAKRCARVRAANVAVLDLEHSGSDACLKIRGEIRSAIREDGCDAIVLGCAGMTDLAKSLQIEFGLPVLDGVACALAMAESTARLGRQTSQAGAYSSVGQKIPKDWQPCFKRLTA